MRQVRSEIHAVAGVEYLPGQAVGSFYEILHAAADDKEKFLLMMADEMEIFVGERQHLDLKWLDVLADEHVCQGTQKVVMRGDGAAATIEQIECCGRHVLQCGVANEVKMAAGIFREHGVGAHAEYVRDGDQSLHVEDDLLVLDRG